MVGIWQGVILTNQAFFKAKSNILYIIKISMTCVYKEYEGKIALTTAKNKRFIGL